MNWSTTSIRSMSIDGYISGVDITSVQEICELNYKIWTHGVQQDYLFHRTKPEPDMPIYRDRPSLVYYLCRLSVKLSYLAGLVHTICIKNSRKVIVFCDWPSTAWLVELVMLFLNFNVLGIRARHLLAEREAAVAAFNDPQNHVQVLVTSVKVSATSKQSSCPKCKAECKFWDLHPAGSTLIEQLPVWACSNAKTQAMIAFTQHIEQLQLQDRYKSVSVISHYGTEHGGQ